jgi:hypothetical protein
MSVQEENCVFELTYNWGVDEPYEKGNAYAQVCSIHFAHFLHTIPLPRFRVCE